MTDHAKMSAGRTAPGSGGPRAGGRGGGPVGGRGLRSLARRLRDSAPVVKGLSLLPWGGAVILRYHSVNDDPVWGDEYIQRSLAVPPDAFDRQVAYLARNHRIVGVDELVEMVSSGRPPDPRAVAITFDDGYEDNYRLAFPILRKHGATATFYVTAGSIDDAAILWTVGLRSAIKRCKVPSLSLGFLEDRPIDISTDGTKETAIRLLTGLVKRCDEIEANDVLAEIHAACAIPANGLDRRVMMNWNEIREMHGSGMTIGAHTVKHYNLPSLEAGVLAREVGESKRELEEGLGAPVEHFAYPDGRTGRHCNGVVAEAVAAAGFRSAATSITGPVSPRYSMYCLPRLGVVPHAWDVGRFAADIQRTRFARPKNAWLKEICRIDPSACGRAEGDAP